MNKLPDGSGFFVASFPLPKDHWLYATSPDGWDEMRDCMPDQPVPILTHAQQGAVVAAVRYAIRGATMRGTKPDFDPDALVQNAVVALCGPYGLDAPQPDSVPRDSGERTAFEHWAFTVRRYRRGNTVQGGYISPPANGAWEGWKATLAQKAVPIAANCELISELDILLVRLQAGPIEREQIMQRVRNLVAAKGGAPIEVVEPAQWQSIETAPKTGRTLLLGYPNVLGKWRTVRGEWISQARIDDEWEEPDDAEAGWYETSVEAEDPPSCWPITPTHWMPLPPAPEQKP